MFNPLSKKEITEIVELNLQKLKEHLSKNNIRIEFSEKAVNYLSKMGYDPQYGARPIKRTIQKELLNHLSKMILSDSIDSTALITVDASSNGLIFINK
jgi:ATP-dependent Clp protease ATP-binding subunit ClpB